MSHNEGVSKMTRITPRRVPDIIDNSMAPSPVSPRSHSGFNSSTNLNRLLSSHHSVYQALQNPDLEMDSPVPQSNDNYDLLSVTSWQSVSNSYLNEESWQAIEKRPSSSVLSSSDNEDPLSTTSRLVKISGKQTKVMVFETDDDEDEDVFDQEDDNATEFINLNDIKGSNPSFIMPRVSLSEENSVFRIEVIGNQSSDQLIVFLNKYFQHKNLRNFEFIAHEDLSATASSSRNLRSSSLIVLLNDGEFNQFNLIFNKKFILFNMVSTNYFHNLNDLLSLNPVQAYKIKNYRQLCIRLLKLLISDQSLINSCSNTSDATIMANSLIATNKCKDLVELRSKSLSDVRIVTKREKSHELIKKRKNSFQVNKNKRQLKLSKIDRVDPLRIKQRTVILVGLSLGIGIGIGITTICGIIYFYNPLLFKGEVMVPMVEPIPLESKFNITSSIKFIKNLRENRLIALKEEWYVDELFGYVNEWTGELINALSSGWSKFMNWSEVLLLRIHYGFNIYE